MSSPSKITFCIVLLALSCAGTGFAQESVVPPARRTVTLADAKALLTIKTAVALPKDPFHSEGFIETLKGNSGKTDVAVATETPARTAPGLRSDRELLQAIAASMKPSGSFVINGEPTLIFGQKRVKAGGSITIPYEGTDYVLEIVSIERPNFTVRLNREQFTRPIK